MFMKDRLVSIREAAKLVGRSEQTIRLWINKGYVQGVKRFPNQRGKIYIPFTELPSFLKEL